MKSILFPYLILGTVLLVGSCETIQSVIPGSTKQNPDGSGREMSSPEDSSRKEHLSEAQETQENNQALKESGTEAISSSAEEKSVSAGAPRSGKAGPDWLRDIHPLGPLVLDHLRVEEVSRWVYGSPLEIRVRADRKAEKWRLWVYLKNGRDNSNYQVYLMAYTDGFFIAKPRENSMKEFRRGDEVLYTFTAAIPDPSEAGQFVRVGFHGGSFPVGDDGLKPYTRGEVESGFLFSPVTDVSSPAALARGFYHLTPPLREEDRWSLKIAYRRSGTGESYRYLDQSRLIDKEPVKVITDPNSPYQMRNFQIVNRDFKPGDIIEYYYILSCEATGQRFSLQNEPPQSYTIAALSRDPEKMFSLEPIPFVSPGQDFDGWLIADYGAADLNLKDWRAEVYYRVGNEGRWRRIDAPPVPKGFDCTIPTSSLPEGTRVVYYIKLINTGTGEELSYRNAGNPLSFRMSR